MERRTIGTRLVGAFRSRRTPGATDVDMAGSELGQRLDPTRWDLGESQRELIEMERLATQTELASDVADAINNPLAALMGRLQMRIEGSQSPDAEDQRLYALGRRIASVVQGMFELSRGTLQAREVPVAEIVEQALTPPPKRGGAPRGEARRVSGTGAAQSVRAIRHYSCAHCPLCSTTRSRQAQAQQRSS